MDLESLLVEPKSIIFDAWERGPSLPAAISGLTFPLGLCLADALDLMGAMMPCPRKGSVCHDILYLNTTPNFPFNDIG